MNLTILSSVFRRALRNISASPYLHMAATGTIAFSILIIGAFAMLYMNINDLIGSWQQNIRVVAYLTDKVPKASIEPLRQNIAGLYGVKRVRFVSKDQAMARLRSQLKHRQSLLDGLSENPLPAAFEIQLIRAWQSWGRIDPLTEQIKAFPEISDVEYGEAWLHRFSAFISFFRLAALIIGGLVFATAVFVCTNTIRLAIYAKRAELEIMRLVGATDFFISTPFYIQNLLEGLLGGLIAIGLLFASYKLFVANVQAPGVFMGPFQGRFLSLPGTGALLAAGMLMGWCGSFLSLKQFLKP
ncbi:MAG: ABC transporter permease [Desulfobacterales bacterium]|nr:ABC transporter permease [Desulfobacterales bacterium]